MATTGYGANPNQSSSSDPRGRMQNSAQYQQQRYESQQGPLADAMSYNYGRGSEADYGNYTDIMNQYRGIASGGAGGGSSSSGGSGGGPASSYSAFTVSPERVGTERASTERATTRALGPLERVQAKDPYESYKGFQEFGQTGGYSPQDISNMRARSIAPIRAAYGNAQRAIGQQRSLQGGYSPNAIAAQVKMAREQGQSMADASTNVEAGLADARQRGRLSGYQGMAGIEGERLAAQMQGDIFNAGQANEGQKFDISNETNTSQFNAGQGNQVGMFNAGQGNNMGQFNANLNYQGQVYNADAQARAQAQNNASAEAAASRSAAANSDDMRNRLAALNGMSNLYGTTPGMSQLFGNQATNIVGQGGNQGLNLMQEERLGQQLPGQWDQTMNRARDVGGMVSQYATPLLDYFGNRNQPQQGNYGGVPGGGYQSNPRVSQPTFGNGGYQQQPAIYSGGISPTPSGMPWDAEWG